MSSFDVQSTTGAKVRFYAIALPFTSNQMKQWLDDGELLPRPPFDRQGDQGGALHRLRRHRARPVHVDRHEECDDAGAAARRPDDRQQLHHRAGAGSDRAGASPTAASIRRRRRWPWSARRATSARPVPRFWRRDSDGPCCWAAASRRRCAGWPRCRRACHGPASKPTRRRCGRRMSCSRRRMRRRRFSPRRSLPTARWSAICRCRPRSGPR